ncbi:MAG: AraC family transcriptional regulator [Oscillospiraceae bacterium]
MLIQEVKIFSDAKENDAQLLRLYHNKVDAGRRAVFEHSHNELEIAIFQSGSGTYLVNNKLDYSVKPGDIFVFASGEKHYMPVVDLEQDLVTMGVHFNPQFIWSPRNDMFSMRFLDIFFNRNASFQHRLDRNNPSTEMVRNLLLQMDQELTLKKEDYALMVKIQLLSILVILNRDYGYTVSSTANTIDKQNMKQIEGAIRYIDEHFKENITLEQLAAIANMSKSYFALLFKTLNGFTAWNYINNKRVQYAIEQLSETNTPVIEIAYNCGFNNSANFNKTFRKVTGTTPSEYRKNPHIIYLFP